LASKFKRKQYWWAKFYHPVLRQSIRESLETTDKARAELLRERLELEVKLLQPRFHAAALPKNLLEHLRPEATTMGREESSPHAGQVPLRGGVRSTA